MSKLLTLMSREDGGYDIYTTITNDQPWRYAPFGEFRKNYRLPLKVYGKVVVPAGIIFAADRKNPMAIYIDQEILGLKDVIKKR